MTFPLALTSLLLALSLAPAPPTTQGQVLICNAGDARTNSASPLLVGTYDRIPVTPNGQQGFYVVYSGRSNPTNNVCIFLFKLVDGPTGRHEVLVFGSGYGDHAVATNDAAFDASKTQKCILKCLTVFPQDTDLRFVVPHGHVDHINPEFVAAMRAEGYGVRDITYHENDAAAIEGLAWTPADEAVFQVITNDTTCSQLAQVNGGAGAFTTTHGSLWFFRRPGHTPGSIDAVLDSDVNGFTTRVIIRGSVENAQCSGFPSTSGYDGTFVVQAHGNAIPRQL